MAAAAPLIALGISAVGTGYSIHQAEEQKDKAKDLRHDQAAEQNKLRGQLEERQRQEDASLAAKEARDRQRLASSKLGRQQTVLTGPQGLANIGGYQGGTYLGGGKKVVA